MHILHLQTVPFQFFIRVLKMVRFPEDFMWYDKEFQIFGSRYLRPFAPNLTWFDFGISRFSFARVRRFVILSWKMSFMKQGLISLRVFENCNAQTTNNSKYPRCFFLTFLLILHTNYCSHYVKNKALAFASFQLYLKTLADDIDQTKRQ